MTEYSHNQFKSVPKFIDSLQSVGRYSFSLDEVLSALSVSEVAVENSLRRLRQRGRILLLRRGFYCIVPAEYAMAGAPPASWFIEDLMKHLDAPYYVGLLSAASLYGASHQQSQVFQVVTDKTLRSIEAGRVSIQFHANRLIEKTPTNRVQTYTGEMSISSPDATAFDLITFADACGGWNNVATVLTELAEKLDVTNIAHLAEQRKTPEIQRLGFLLDYLGLSALGQGLPETLSSRRMRSTLFAPQEPSMSMVHEEIIPWRVIPNLDIEIDV